MSRILVVDDEDKIREVIVAYLLKAGYDTCEAGNGHHALQQLNSNHVDLILLDLMLPDISGEDLCNHIRTFASVPIIMLTAKSSMNHRIQGLATGADDYIVKPFDPNELIARIRAVLRRTNQQDLLADRMVYANGRFIVDSNKQQVFINQMQVSLTPNEYKLLIVMARNPERTFTREELIEKIMGLDFDGDARIIDQHVKNLRQKIEEDPKNPKHIQTVFGVGYRFHGGTK